MSASSELREATAKAHQELEQAPMAESLASGRIELLSYVDYLRAIAVVITNLLTAIRRNGDPEQIDLLPTLTDWSARINADIGFLAPNDTMANKRAQAAALELTQKLFRKVVDDPAWVFGVAYVIYGSHNGNQRVADAVSSGLGFSGETGTTYLRATRSGPTVWPQFRALVDQNLIESEALDSARRGAIDAFECFSKVFDALQHHPEREVAASAVNPEAGDHPVPQDENLARIADDVGKKCHAAFGYLCRRYGSRGEAFARSDGAWMVTLGEIPILRAHKRIDWLAKLLSARGIPSLCLEQHLGMLHEALSNAHALPQNEPDRLLQLAHRVGARRRAVITEADWNKLIEIRVPALDPLGAATIISAIIDQRVGLAPCADSITGWLETCPTLESNDRCELLALFNHLGA